MNKLLIFLGTIYIGYAQNTYIGSISFDYNGSVNGSFQAEISDSTLGGATAGTISFDSSSTLLISALDAIDSATVSLLLIYLTSSQDAIYPGTWALPPNDITNPDVVFGFFPEVDTSFFSQFADLVPDSTDLDSTFFEDLIESLFTIITTESYVGLTGSVSIDHIDADSLVGSFDVAALQAGFPPGVLDISNGSIDLTGVALPQVEIENEIHTPSENSLHSAFPNPFNPTTNIRFSVETWHHTSLQVFNITGQLVETLVSGQLKPGTHEILWDASEQPSGVYFIQLVSDGSVQTEKVLLVK